VLAEGRFRELSALKGNRFLIEIVTTLAGLGCSSMAAIVKSNVLVITITSFIESKC
jgi:hypothetical protein